MISAHTVCVCAHAGGGEVAFMAIMCGTHIHMVFTCVAHTRWAVTLTHIHTHVTV